MIMNYILAMGPYLCILGSLYYYFLPSRQWREGGTTEVPLQQLLTPTTTHERPWDGQTRKIIPGIA